MTKTLTDLDAELRQDPEYVQAERDLQPALDLADAVLGLRLDAGMTLRDLARKARISYREAKRIEMGLANPQLRTVQRIAEALDAGLEIRLRRPAEDKDTLRRMLSEKRAELADALAKLDDCRAALLVEQGKGDKRPYRF